jgi:hypothetical protein
MVDNDFISRLRSLRKEKENLERELSVLVVQSSDQASYHDRGLVDARYARALRIQKIDREIMGLKRENIVRIQ